MWPTEEIPIDAIVYMRVHQNWFRGGELDLGVFRNHGLGMSVDWSKYSSPEETQSRASSPSKNGIISMSVGPIRSIEGLSVEHEPIQENTRDEKGVPIPPNRAHSEIFGEKTTERRVKLSRMFSWAIPLPGANE